MSELVIKAAGAGVCCWNDGRCQAAYTMVTPVQVHRLCMHGSPSHHDCLDSADHTMHHAWYAHAPCAHKRVRWKKHLAGHIHPVLDRIHMIKCNRHTSQAPSEDACKSAADSDVRRKLFERA